MLGGRVVGWLEGRAVRMFLGSYRGDGRTRYYIARRARPVLIARYEPRIARRQSLSADTQSLRSLSKSLRSLSIALFGKLGGLMSKESITQKPFGGVRPPRFLPESANNLDVPL